MKYTWHDWFKPVPEWYASLLLRNLTHMNNGPCMLNEVRALTSINTVDLFIKNGVYFTSVNNDWILWINLHNPHNIPLHRRIEPSYEMNTNIHRNLSSFPPYNLSIWDLGALVMGNKATCLFGDIIYVFISILRIQMFYSCNYNAICNQSVISKMLWLFRLS